MALDYKAAAGGGTFTLIPVGLSFDARKSFRSRVRVSFGEPIPVAPYAAVHREDPARAVEARTTAVQGGMEAEILPVARPERQDLIRALEQIYRGDLIRERQEGRGLGGGQVGPVRRSPAIPRPVRPFAA